MHFQHLDVKDVEPSEIAKRGPVVIGKCKKKSYEPN